MSQKKISELTSTASVKDHNIFPLVQDGVTKHIKYGDLKVPLVKEVEANVESYVDTKLENRTRYANESMVGLGFANKSTVSVRNFWNNLYDKHGSQGVIHFTWNDAGSAYIGADSNTLLINGGTLVYTCDKAPNLPWGSFSAIWYAGYTSDAVYHINSFFASDTTDGAEFWSITKLANNNDVLSIRSNLEDVSEKLENTRNYYTDANSTIGRAIGRWHDGRRVWRVVYQAKDLTVTSAQVGNGSVYGFIGGLTKQRHVDFFLSAKVHWKNGATLQDLEVLLANNDCLFVVGGANSSLTTGNVESLIVEFVEK